MDDIATSGFWKGMPEYTEAEVDLVVEFCEARQRGEDPDPEEYLARCPEHRDRLAALLEGEQVIAGHFKRVKDKYPGLCPRRFLGLPASLR
jgi:hypothetical protein